MVWSAVLKRLFDLALLPILVMCFCIALCVIVVLNPFFNPGPLFYKQTRVGRFGREFVMVKFRSIQGDGAMSRPAEFMRKTRVDELPQIWNVLKGEMSLIGPRPERPELVKDYMRSLPHYTERLLMRPGISGLAQLRVGYTQNLPGAGAKLVWDLYYIRHYSIALDIHILVQTASVVFSHLFKRPIQSAL